MNPQEKKQSPKIVLITAPSEESAIKIAKVLLSKKLIACANLIPGIKSIYHWQGKVEESQEVLMIIKTQESCIKEAEKVTLELHPYDTPEFLVLDPSHVTPKYLAWLLAETEQN
jgi:periplasmic divalent cation tolerance protein